MTTRQSSGRTQYWGLTIQEGPWKQTKQDERNKMTSLGSKTFWGGGIQGAGKIHAGHAGAFSSTNPVKTPNWGDHPKPMPGPSRYAQRSLVVDHRVIEQFRQQLPPGQRIVRRPAITQPMREPDVESEFEDEFTDAPTMDTIGTQDQPVETPVQATPPPSYHEQVVNNLIREENAVHNATFRSESTQTDPSVINAPGPEQAGPSRPGRRPVGVQANLETREERSLRELNEAMSQQNKDMFEAYGNELRGVHAEYQDRVRGLIAALGIDPGSITGTLTPRDIQAIAESSHVNVPHVLRELEILRHLHTRIYEQAATGTQTDVDDLIQQAMHTHDIEMEDRAASGPDLTRRVHSVELHGGSGGDETLYRKHLARHKKLNFKKGYTESRLRPGVRNPLRLTEMATGALIRERGGVHSGRRATGGGVNVSARDPDNFYGRSI